jgi:very-short-patch-repair endonuclease
MRHESTLSENKFWWRVRNRRLCGYKFKRQFLIGNYIVEVDGGQHGLQQRMTERAMNSSLHVDSR